MRLLPALAIVSLSLSLASVAGAQQQPTPDPDLIKLGQSVLPTDDPAPTGSAARADAAAARGRDAAAPGAAPEAGASAATNTAPTATAAPDSAAPAQLAGGPASREDAGAARDVDGGAAVDAAVAAKPEEPAPASPPVGLGPAARNARIASGKNLALAGPTESPLAKVVPPAAVPAVATVATIGAMAIWPFLIKTLTGLLKSIFASFIKTRAKKGEKIDKAERTLIMAGFVVRPVELAALLLGALIYVLGVCYAFQGRHMKASFLVAQEALVIVIYYARSFVRFAYERLFKLNTRYKFWAGGGLLCLASAYLGNTLGTVGYELEETRTPEDADRIVKMKAWLIGISLLMAIGFFAANVLSPAKILQSGRVMMSGVALAEILPITPMPGLKIYRWSPVTWANLVLCVVPTFILINFIL